MALISSEVLSARERLSEGRQQARRLHEEGLSGTEVCRQLSALRDEVICGLFASALAEAEQAGRGAASGALALVAHGGFGRAEVAPFSDVDVLLLHEPGGTAIALGLVRRLLRDVFDAGLVMGHNVCTIAQACRLASTDVRVATSLLHARLLAGDDDLFARFCKRLRQTVRRRGRALCAQVVEARTKERARYGETIYLLEPNVKRSRGGLRDVQLLGWLGALRYETGSLEELEQQRLLDPDDCRAVAQAAEFLLRLRNEMHFHAGQAADVLDRAEQVRIAALRAYRQAGGMLPVEQFMRDYFCHTGAVSRAVGRLSEAALSRPRWSRWLTVAFGHRAHPGLRVGPGGIVATRAGLRRLRGDLAAVVRLLRLAAAYGQPIAPATWEAVCREAPALPAEPSAEAARELLALLESPARLGPTLQSLHEAVILERFVPEFACARGLLQFNQYHKYTVDEHCLRAVESATEFAGDPGLLGRTYREIGRKGLLHLALLLHDLGKCRLEDHREVGRQIAVQAAQRLALPARDAKLLEFLVHKHMLMNHLAFRRDTSDQQLVVRFAVEVGSPEVLRMLLVLTAADLAAVGPGVWDAWKAQVLGDLYHRTMLCLAADSPETVLEQQTAQRRKAVGACLGEQKDEPFFRRQLEALPAGYLSGAPPERVAADLRLLSGLAPGEVRTETCFDAETQSLEFTLATSEQLTEGIFHKTTGALSACGLEIRSASIHTLADRLVLDRFWLRDPDSVGAPPAWRCGDVEQAVVEALTRPTAGPPRFRRVWQAGARGRVFAPTVQTRVQFDNRSSARYTILDVFAIDRPGLLYAVARELFELGLEVGRAKIGTFLDQVVDVFYVTDRQQRKIEDEDRLEAICGRLLEVASPPAD